MAIRFSDIRINNFRLLSTKEHDKKTLQDINKRNTRLFLIFRNCYTNVRLIGSIDNPMVVIGNEFGVPGNVHNFSFNIRETNSFESPLVYRLSLSGTNTNPKKMAISDILEGKVEFFKVYRLRNKEGYYYAGYQFPVIGDPFPVFCNELPRLYASLEKARERVNELKEYGYKFEVV